MKELENRYILAVGLPTAFLFIDRDLVRLTSMGNIKHPHYVGVRGLEDIWT